ncbi:transcriptional regulator containing an amidase domain and an AraC-type DNA-binding HTH domain [Microvirga lotononidis]|uniref:Transcriptional regulator containing an amidase domain and an AraC-type DNA-binding HTH domain n=2 Tax=Microvirga lotononidis TaxID=864069 RepID=I4YQI3_9HYPH|nr:transcriptional regulator containing an amidase domain and an AraC-type DNA-binding HTH domain [Microvirga lotononidis]
MLDDPRIARAVRLIELTPAREMTLTDVAAHVGLTPFHFQRYFQAFMGESPSAYLRRTRLDRAAMNLQMSDEPITRIAFNAGYASHEAFIRAFQRQFSIAPSQYRALAQQARPQPSQAHLARLPQVSVGTRPSLRLLALRFHGPYAQVEDHWRRFAAYLEQIGYPLDQAEAVGVILDTPLITPGEMIRYDCAVIDRGIDVSESALQELEFQAGRYVSYRHEGPYAEIFHAFETVSLAWLQTSGEMFLPDGNGGYEFYHQPPWKHAGGAQALSIVLPLAG